MQFKDKFVDLRSPRVMGILNVTPDSFSDGGQFSKLDKALVQAERMIEQGADFLDVGGESTRPGAKPVSLQQELDRVIPVIEGIVSRFDTVVSIDTSKSEVMKAAVSAGAGLINDVRALQQGDALTVAASLDVPICLMHMQGTPDTMQRAPSYDDLLLNVIEFLTGRINACVAAGIPRTQIIADPGFGFGKSLEHNYELLARLDELKALNVPILSGTSRKSMIGNLLNRDVAQRMAGSIVTAGLALQGGAQIFRVHDVQQTLDALKITTKVTAYRNSK